MCDMTGTKDDAKTETWTNRHFPAGLLHILSKYADTCSLTGVVFIKSSKSLGVKLTWACLLLVALCLMSYHLYSLSATYLEYKKQTKIDLTFSNLQFPALTICNANPVRMSMTYMASEDLNSLIDATDPAKILELVEEWVPPVNSPTMILVNGSWISAPPVDPGNFIDNIDLKINITLPWGDDMLDDTGDEDTQNTQVTMGLICIIESS
ncbi:degenerin del-1-like [Physella acuta]|uniref:degenerin del-1-like n=1 Tax=Physella acuta TaxID=109671 RepID=UPI0027DDF10B|nr:degenerin del-1-like [Physella acuta]